MTSKLSMTLNVNGEPHDVLAATTATLARRAARLSSA